MRIGRDKFRVLSLLERFGICLFFSQNKRIRTETQTNRTTVEIASENIEAIARLLVSVRGIDFLM